MTTVFQKPENALKRAEQLISVGEPGEALNVLHSTISHRRLRLHGWDPNAELIMLKYVRLCVDLEKLKFVREGLHFYRTLTQQHNVLSLAKVMKELRDLSEEKLEAVKARASDEAALASGVDDLEADETPESLMLLTLQVEVRDKTAKELHTALLGCWESYKIIMDLLRFAPKIDYFYHDTARRALDFCRANKRPQEFRRLCDTLRMHYVNFQKYRSRPDFEPFLRPENHIPTRLAQMDVAADLRLWSQCFQTAEDILGLGLHDLLQRSLTTKDPALYKSRAVLLSQTSMFYEKLAQIFQVSGQLLFHASAVLRNLFHTRQHKRSVTKAEQVQLSDIASLAVLCVPVLQKSNPTAAELEYQKRLATMLGHGTTTSRTAMQSVIETRGILAAASPEVQALYAHVEGDVNPMTFCTRAEELIQAVIVNREETLGVYVPALKRVVFDRLLLKLGRIYTSMSIDFFVNSVCPDTFLCWREAEAMIVQLVHEGFVQLRLDYSRRMIFFGDAVASADSIVKNRLATIANVLADVVQRQGLPGSAAERAPAIKVRDMFYSNFAAKLAAEEERLRQRNKAVADRRLRQEQEQQAREEARKTKEKEKQRLEEQEEQDRREAALRQQDILRRREAHQQLMLLYAQQIVAEFKSIAEKANGKIVVKGKALEDITPDDILRLTYDYEDYERAQEELRTRERQERSRQHRQESKRAEHLVRALREEEAQLLKDWKQQTHEQDVQLIKELQVELEEELDKRKAERQRQRNIFLSIKPFKETWVAERIAEREARWKAQCQQRLERIKHVLKQRKLERARETRRRIEQERIETEAREKREAEEQRRKEEEEARRRVAETQRRKDLEIEQREQQQLQMLRNTIPSSTVKKSADDVDWSASNVRGAAPPRPTATPGKSNGVTQDVNFVRRLPDPEAPVAPPKTKKYVPPQQRLQSAAAVSSGTVSEAGTSFLNRSVGDKDFTRRVFDTSGPKPIQRRQGGSTAFGSRQDVEIVRGPVVRPSSELTVSGGSTMAPSPEGDHRSVVPAGDDGFTTVTKKQKSRSPK